MIGQILKMIRNLRKNEKVMIMVTMKKGQRKLKLQKVGKERRERKKKNEQQILVNSSFGFDLQMEPPNYKERKIKENAMGWRKRRVKKGK